MVAAFTDMARLAAYGAAPAVQAVTAAAPVADVGIAFAPLAAAPAGAAPAAATSAPPPPAQPVLLVELAGGTLPRIAAVSLVAADGALSRVDASRVFHVEALPARLATLISRGEIVDLAPSPTASPATAEPGHSPEASTIARPVALDGHATADSPQPAHAAAAMTEPAAPAPAGTGAHAVDAVAAPVAAAPVPEPAQPVADTSPATPSPADVAHVVVTPAPAPVSVPNPVPVLVAPSPDPATVVVPAPAPPEIVPPPASPAILQPPPPPAVAPLAPVLTTPALSTPHNPAIDAAILDFVGRVAKVAIMVSDHEVVFYDPHILEFLKPGEVIDSVTWKLEDGSSVSLVGVAADLHGYHGIG